MIEKYNLQRILDNPPKCLFLKSTSANSAIHHYLYRATSSFARELIHLMPAYHIDAHILSVTQISFQVTHLSIVLNTLQLFQLFVSETSIKQPAD